MICLKTTFFILLFNLFVITGCSSKHDVKVTEVFRSNILDDDAKMFTFSIIFINRTKLANNADAHDEKSKGERQGKGRGKKGKSTGKQSLENQMTEELETRLLEKLEDNGYCRKGYFELNRTLNRTIYTINGECSESATPADRKNFK